MNRSLVAASLAAVILAGCASPDPSQSQAVDKSVSGQASASPSRSNEAGSAPSASSTAPEDFPSSEPTIDQGILTTTIRLPSDWVDGATLDELEARVMDSGFAIDVTLNDDGSASYRMTRSEYGAFMEKMRIDSVASLNEQLEELGSDAVFKGIEPSDDLREFTVLVDGSQYGDLFFEGSGFAFSILFTSAFYQLFAGVDRENAYLRIEYLDKETNDVVDVYDSREAPNDQGLPDWFEDEGSVTTIDQDGNQIAESNPAEPSQAKSPDSPQPSTPEPDRPVSREPVKKDFGPPEETILLEVGPVAPMIFSSKNDLDTSDCSAMSSAVVRDGDLIEVRTPDGDLVATGTYYWYLNGPWEDSSAKPKRRFQSECLLRAEIEVPRIPQYVVVWDLSPQQVLEYSLEEWDAVGWGVAIYT